MRFKRVIISTSLFFLLWLWKHVRNDQHFTSSAKRSLQGKEEEEAEYDVQIQIFLAGDDELRDLIAKTPFLKAGLEQSIKDFLNHGCTEALDIPSYHRIELEIPEKNTNRRLQRENPEDACVPPDIALGWENVNCVKMKSKCRGKKKKCQDTVNERILDILKMKSSQEGLKSDLCLSNPLEFFNERKLALATFVYATASSADPLDDDVEVDFSVSFEPGAINIKENIGNISAEAFDPVESETDCTKTECTDQRQILQDIYNDFGLDFNEDMHECEHLGINCDGKNNITHIWLDNRDLRGKITDNFSRLESLKGIFLGQNKLSGSIPSSLSKLKELQSLWLENNHLTGSIFTQIKTMRKLEELSLCKTL